MRYRDNPLIEQRYNCERWKKVRKLKRLMVHGTCEMCLAKGKYYPGKIVHHIEPITDLNFMNDDIMYGMDNLMYVCDNCHKEIHGEAVDYFFDEEGNVCQKKQR